MKQESAVGESLIETGTFRSPRSSRSNLRARGIPDTVDLLCVFIPENVDDEEDGWWDESTLLAHTRLNQLAHLEGDITASWLATETLELEVPGDADLRIGLRRTLTATGLEDMVKKQEKISHFKVEKGL